MDIHNRYIKSGCAYRRTETGSRRSGGETAHTHARNAGDFAPPSLFGVSDGISGLIRSILPDGIETGDILLLLILLFLYEESKDEEFLIILVVVAFSFFEKK